MRNNALLAACLLTVMVTACGSSEQPEVIEQIVVREPGDPAPATADLSGDLVAMGEDAFQVCTGCHTVDAGAPSAAGPNLHGVVGRVAGSLENFPYSEALAASQVTWDEATLDRYLADPAGYIPGTDMQVGTVTDPEARAAIIAYLASVSQ
ncbi:MAG: c-type cytochrome [Erythrobacter sp.]